jgi:hypothetical protein
MAMQQRRPVPPKAPPPEIVGGTVGTDGTGDGGTVGMVRTVVGIGYARTRDIAASTSARGWIATSWLRDEAEKERVGVAVVVDVEAFIEAQPAASSGLQHKETQTTETTPPTTEIRTREEEVLEWSLVEDSGMRA